MSSIPGDLLVINTLELLAQSHHTRLTVSEDKTATSLLKKQLLSEDGLSAMTPTY